MDGNSTTQYCSKGSALIPGAKDQQLQKLSRHCKKICMWLLVGVGAIIDSLITYAANQASVTFHFGYLIASLAAMWLIRNEIISILENISDIGVDLPPFLLKFVVNLKSQVEGKADQTFSNLIDDTQQPAAAANTSTAATTPTTDNKK